MLDTLKLAQSLERGGFSKEMAEATATALNEAIADQVATKHDVERLEGMIGRLGDKITVLMWAVGINAAATITMLVKHW
jgi:hypothetical protein